VTPFAPRRVVTLRALAAAALTVALLLTAGIAYVHRQLLAGSGLSAEYRTGTDSNSQPRLQVIDTDVSVALVRRRAEQLGGSGFTATWTGYLIVPARGTYRLALYADDRASLEIDRRPIVNTERTRREAAVELSAGLHPLDIRYADEGGRQGFELVWARGDETPVGIPRLLFVPRLVSGEEVRQRRMVTAIGGVLPLAWSAFLIASVAVLIVRACTSGGAPESRFDWQMLPIYVVAGVVFSAGIWWGLPDYKGWAPDELTPGEVADFLERGFTGGWATTYPPLHYAVVAGFSTPLYAAASLGVLDRNGLQGYTQLFVAGRMLSVAMAVGVIAMIYRLSRDELGGRAGRLAAAVLATVLPLTYYARTTNLDVPYLFWLAASLVCYIRAGRSGDTRSYCLFALTGAAAIATKDQAYGFYVLPAVSIAGRALFHARDTSPPPGVPSVRALCAMSAVFVAAMLIFFNVAFNPSGVREHLRIIVGPGSEPYRMYPRSLAGHGRMFAEAVWQIGTAMSWPMFAISAWGTAQAVRARIPSIRRLFLPAVSYYLTFITVVMYPYDRFFLGICIPLAVGAGWWLDRWTRAGAPRRRLRIAIAGIALAFAAARVVAFDALTILDSRYEVERWLVARTGPGTVIGAEGPSQYLPRPSRVLWNPVPQDLGALESLHPDFLVVNLGYARRGAAHNQFYDALDNGSAGYRRALRYRTSVPLSPLRWEARFDQLAEDPFSNLTKVNPVIDVYERVR
jgi:4-amino-4-deoxy-L-arabinose transferase-like glycosyltransferase